MNEEKNYVIKREYTLTIIIIVIFSFILVPIIFSRHLDITTLVIGIFALVIFSIKFLITNLLFDCPNCGEQITLNENKLDTINDNESTCSCPKCNKELIFNNKKFTVRINNIIEQKKSNTNIIDGKSTEKLEELYNLKIKGIITEDEFERKKQDILNRM